VKSKASDQGEEFFVTGLEKYLDVKSAVTMFEKEVQRRVKEVIATHQSELAKWFGDDSVWRDYSQSGAPEDWLCLGQKVAFKGSGALYFYLCFERDEQKGPCLSLGATFWREKVTLLNPLWTSVGAIQHTALEVDGSHIFLTGNKPSNDWESCEKELNALIRDWIELWRKLGGLPKYLVAQDPPV
jgi:hypothetical protein